MIWRKKNVTEKTIRERLGATAMPGGGDALHNLEGLQVENGTVTVILRVDPAAGTTMENFRVEVEAQLRALPGVKRASVILTAERPATETPPESSSRQAKSLLGNIPHVIAVSSGKGGVGKSTVALNLACALALRGLKTGLLDADIYGPSVPRLTGLRGRKPDGGGDADIEPLEAHGLKIMSIGFMVAEDTPMIWRGPMVQSALIQMMRDVNWGNLDVLIIDMPPGTGDAQLTLAQKVALSGAVIVSTPQDIALIDARKGLNMFRQVEIPIIGIVENMSYYCCPHCGQRDDIFGHGGARAEAGRLGAPFLGEIPLQSSVRHYSDAGTPAVLQEDSPAKAAYLALAAAVEAFMTGSGAKKLPDIIME